MAHAIELTRRDRSSAELRLDAKRCSNGRVACRILAIAHMARFSAQDCRSGPRVG